MFTGLVNSTAVISSVDRKNDSMIVTITNCYGQLSPGESISVDGVCLTVINWDADSITFELSSETLSLTTFSECFIGQLVNCERAISASDRLGGHVVTGHVDETISVKSVVKQNEFTEIIFCGVDCKNKSFLVNKGSIAINGVSLTINSVSNNCFSIMLIPHTLKITNLSNLKAGNYVNIEYDYIAKLTAKNNSKTKKSSLVDEAINAIKNGEMVILLDDEDRENEGDLVVAAEKVTAEHINFMAKYGRGLICLPMLSEDFKRLDISMMTEENQSGYQTAFGVSIGAAKGITTGISAQDRAYTILVAADPKSTDKDIVKPGHVFPLKARDGGLLERNGHTEASTDLMRLAGLKPMAAICEIMNDDGSMARLDDLKQFSIKHKMPLLRIADLKDYLLQKENIVEKKSQAILPTKFGKQTICVYQDKNDSSEWVAVIFGDLSSNKNPLVRLHSECLTGDVLGSMRCDCGDQLQNAMQKLAESGGVLLYMPQEGRGIGLVNKIKAYALQDKGLDTVEANLHLGFGADERDYSTAVDILKDLGVSKLSLLTNNPAKVDGLEKSGIEVLKRVALSGFETIENLEYLKTKKLKMKHIFEL